MTLPELLSDPGLAFEKPRSLYVHVPFCASRCAYCDFHSFPRSSIPPAFQKRYVEVVLKRAETLSRVLSASYETLYIGGGTPTVLSDESFDQLISGLGSLFGSSVREWTVEANPESLSEGKIETLLANSVSRISIGIQSMDEGELSILGRKASLADNRRAIALAVESGMAVSADLIGGIPFRPEEADKGKTSRPPLSETAAFLAESGIGHISIYDLVVEEGTAIKKLLDEGKLVSAEEDSSYEERKEAERVIGLRGFARYEVSNYALPGRECLHSMTYWSMNSYLGVGSGAVSTLNRSGALSATLKAAPQGNDGCSALRIEEGRDLALYAEAPDDAAVTTWIDRKDSAFEWVMMALRTKGGLDEKRFESRFGLRPREILAGTIHTWESLFSESRPGYLGLNDKGLDILNRILVDALEEMDIFFKPKTADRIRATRD